MKILFDTSILVAALYREHQFHQAALPWLAATRNGALELVVAAHSLAEFYASVTRLPRGWAVTGSEALQLLRSNVLGHARVRTLRANGYVSLLDRLESRGLIGGVVYDGVIAEVARLENVDGLLTLNPGHFQRIWPDDADRILDPRTTEPPIDSTSS